MRLACCTIAFKEERFIPKFIESMQDRVDKIVVLNSIKPWFGDNDPIDETAYIARQAGAEVIAYDWPSEHAQRNAGQEYLSEYDWIIVLDPDEYIDNENWDKLVKTLETADAPAYVVEHQRVFYKNKEVYPHTDYQQIIAVRPSVRFVDGRVINSAYGVAAVELLHFSWARTDDECWRKITHYTHANQFDARKWFTEVWKTDRDFDLHPNTPETLKALITPKLPPEIERLQLWP